jgi:hypothetical protein
LADKQYTFRTTKSTEWLEEILDQIPKSSRSALIRELIITGLEVHGIVADYNTLRRHNLMNSLRDINTRNPIVQKLSQNLTQNVSQSVRDVRDNLPQNVGDIRDNVTQNVREEITHNQNMGGITEPVLDGDDLFETKEDEPGDLEGALDNLDFDSFNFE